MLVSYSVARESRRKGLGKEIVCMIPKIIENENIPGDKIIAEVLIENEASNKIFNFAGHDKHQPCLIFCFIN